MTTPRVPARRQPLGLEDDSMTDWFTLHKRELTWAVLALAILFGGLWFWRRSQSIKATRAEAAYFQARRSAAAGNLPLAVTELQKVANRYEGTRSGTQARLFVAQLLYQQKKYKEGVAELKKAESKAGAEDLLPSIYVLEATGHEELKDFIAAAERYKMASAATRFAAEKEQFLAAAARAYAAGGKTAEAKAIWTTLAADDAGTMAAEARVRLGELNAKPMKI